jgi:hypothetical protein
MAGEPRAEQIVAALVERLRTILGDSGTTFWYTPEHVQRVDDFAMPYLTPPDLKAETLYLVRKGDCQPVLGTTGTNQKRLEIWVLMARRRDPREPAAPSKIQGDLPSTVQERLLADLTKRVQQDINLQAAGLNFVSLVEITRENRAFDIQGWVVAEALLTASYWHPRAQP